MCEWIVDVISFQKNIWFLWCKRSYSGDKKGCHARGRWTTDDGQRRNVKIELEFWEPEFAKKNQGTMATA